MVDIAVKVANVVLHSGAQMCKYLTTGNFGPDIHVSLGMESNDFGVLFTFHMVPS